MINENTFWIKTRHGTPIDVTYRNWEGRVDHLKITPSYVWYGSTEWHKEPQWLMYAFNVERGVYRDYALKDMLMGHVDKTSLESR